MKEITPKSSVESVTKSQGPSIVRSQSLESLTSTKLSDWTLSRTDTGLSSLAGFAGRPRKNVIERQHFPHVEKKGGIEKMIRRHTVDHGKKNSGQSSKFNFSDMKPPQRNPEHASPPGRRGSSALGLLIQDRRQRAAKLRIPIDMPSLPSRSRPPAASPRPRLIRHETPARTPWTADHPQPGHEGGFANTTSTIPEHDDFAGMYTATTPMSAPVDTDDKQPKKRLSLTRLRFRRTRSSGTRTSTDSSHPASPGQQAQSGSQADRPPLDLHRRWSGTRWPLHSGVGSNHPSPEKSPFSVNRFLKSKPSGSPTTSPQNPSDSPQQKYFWRQRRSLFVRSDPCNNEPMASPPSPVPPDIDPEPSPIELSPHGEVRGQLADFRFDNQSAMGGRQRPPKSPVPNSIWDSDALLMPMRAMTPSSSEDSASSEGPMTTPPLARQPHLAYSNKNPSPYLKLPSSAPPTGHWFRVPVALGEDTMDEDTLLQAEETARLEWNTPEHLPNSPLCPLH